MKRIDTTKLEDGFPQPYSEIQDFFFGGRVFRRFRATTYIVVICPRCSQTTGALKCPSCGSYFPKAVFEE